MGGAWKLTDFIEEDGARMLQPASYVTTGFYKSFELMVRTRGRRPTSSFLLCSLFSDALSQTQRAYLDFPRPREWQAAASHYREVFATYAILAQDILLRLQNRRVYVVFHVQVFRAGLDFMWGDRLTRWTRGVRNALEAGDALLPFPTEEWNFGAQTLEEGDELPPFPMARGPHQKEQTWR